jgi:hypothetical protein
MWSEEYTRKILVQLQQQQVYLQAQVDLCLAILNTPEQPAQAQQPEQPKTQFAQPMPEEPKPA